MSSMHEMDAGLVAMDGRTLRFLKHLLATSSVTRTAAYLGISQPAASRILARVRDMIGDPILVRTQAGYQLTDHALRLKGPVDTAIMAISDVFTPIAFDPEKSSYRFRVASTDYGVAAVLGPMMDRFADTAPAICVDVSPLVPQSFADLQSGAIDLMLYADLNITNDLLSQKLFDETYEILFRPNHPLQETLKSSRNLSPDDLSCYRLIEFKFPGTTALRPDTIMRSGEDSANAVFQQPYFTTIPFLLGSGDAVAVVPKRLADRVRNLTPLCSAPFQSDHGFPYHLLRHPRSRHNPAINWIVEQAMDIDRTKPGRD